jgi:hypothetical protein
MVPHVGTEPVYDLPAPDSLLVLESMLRGMTCAHLQTRSHRV